VPTIPSSDRRGAARRRAAHGARCVSRSSVRVAFFCNGSLAAGGGAVVPRGRESAPLEVDSPGRRPELCLRMLPKVLEQHGM
jgi:hypothetical protein